MNLRFSLSTFAETYGMFRLISLNLLGPFRRWQTTTGSHFLAMMGAAAQAKGESHEAYSGSLNGGLGPCAPYL